MKNIFNRLPASDPARRTRLFFLAVAVLLGFLQAWASRMDLVSDTVSYLDMGDGIWHGHPAIAVNGIWGPLYATMLGAVIGTVRPSPHWEYPLVHLVVFAIFLFALWGFDFLLREMIALRRESDQPGTLSVPAWVWVTIGYVLFLWASLQLIQVSETNPDMLVAALFYVACGLLVRIRRNVAGWWSYLSLGFVLGLGYLTKSIMFPVSCLCLIAAFAIGRHQRRQVAAAITLFLFISGSFVSALSAEKGRFTFGESGRYNYAVHINHVPRTHWQGEIAGSGTPIHPTRQICDRPATFEFATPLEGTYAAWTDPSYWYDGVQTPFNLRRSVVASARLLYTESLFFLELHGGWLAALFVMFYVAGRKWRTLKDVSALWFLLLPALGALGMYALIHIEPRYLAPFLAVLLLALFFSVQLPSSTESRRLCSAVAIFLVLMYFCPIESNSLHVKEFVRDVAGRSTPDPNSYQAMAGEMASLGLKPGDPIASLDYSLWGMSTWARLARAKIVAEVYYWPNLDESAANDFWKTDIQTQAKVIEAIRKTGARVIVSQMPPVSVDAKGWNRVGSTNYYAYWLNR